MALVKTKPTSPGRRSSIKLLNTELYKGRPEKRLIEKQSNKAGRNNYGRITTRHRGGGHKQHYRLIDFKRDKINVLGIVERIEYDPNRTANIALICYRDGERRYIIAAKGLNTGSEICSGKNAQIKPGNAMQLRDIPMGTVVHCVELLPGKGAQLARSAGSSVQLQAREGNYAQLKLKSGEIRKVHIDCYATIGEVGNAAHNLRSIGKAGAVRWRGIRPTVRGVAMNPIDHPHGGGEGRTSSGRHPVSPWGTPAKGYRTRKNKRTEVMIVRHRYSKKG